jgi:tRNA G26 N,N-dimethylase Trm1
MQSKERLNKVKDSLESIINEIDDMYYSLNNELSEEINTNKSKQEKIEKETNDIFYKLDHDICMKLIKKKLPLRVKLFNKIEWAGHGVSGNGFIRICFKFNNSHDAFEYIFKVEEINEYLKIN